MEDRDGLLPVFEGDADDDVPRGGGPDARVQFDLGSATPLNMSVDTEPSFLDTSTNHVIPRG